MNDDDKPVVWLHGEVKTPPFSQAARLEVGWLLRRLQEGEHIGMPHSRPMQGIGAGCHELRIGDRNRNWRIIYRIDNDAVIVVEVFNKTTSDTPSSVIDSCRRRLRAYDTDIERK